MKKNMGSTDKVIRILIGAIVTLLYFTHLISGVVAFILLIFSGILVITTLAGFCPIYYPLGLNTVKNKIEKAG